MTNLPTIVDDCCPICSEPYDYDSNEAIIEDNTTMDNNYDFGGYSVSGHIVVKCVCGCKYTIDIDEDIPLCH